MTTRDWPAFWKSLTPAEAMACLKAAPGIAGPWEAGYTDKHYLRSVVGDSHATIGHVPKHRRKDFDDRARANGWILVDKEGGK